MIIGRQSSGPWSPAVTVVDHGELLIAADGTPMHVYVVASLLMDASTHVAIRARNDASDAAPRFRLVQPAGGPPWLPNGGGAARGIARRLRKHAYHLLTDPEGFVVEDTDGPSGETLRRRRGGSAGAGNRASIELSRRRPQVTAWRQRNPKIRPAA
jgi:hypothetical protein